MEQQTVTTDAGAPAPDPDAAKYDELRKELGIEAEGQEPEPTEPQAEPKSEPAAEPPAEPQHVPRAEHENVQRALREAREQAQTAKAEKTAILQLIEQARQRQPEVKEEPKLPDKLEDPIGHYDARIAQLEQMVQQGQLSTQQANQQLGAWQQEQTMKSVAEASEAAIIKEKPDYWEACGHLESMRMAQLDAFYPDSSPQAAHYAHQQGFRSTQELKVWMLNQDRRMVLEHSMQMGVSPAQFYYDMAQKVGYQPKTVKPNGVDKGKQQIEAAKKGRAASLSISGDSGGRKGAQDMSITDLADLAIEDGEAFDKVWEQMAKAGKLG